MNESIPTAYVQVDESLDGPLFDTVADMTEAATLVMSAEVAQIDSLGLPDAQEDPDPSEYLAVSVRPIEVIKGEPPDPVVMAWEAFVTDGSGRRTHDVVLNGLRAPALGDRVLLFLGPDDPGRRALFDGIPTHYPVSLGGVAFLDGDVVADTADGSILADEFSGATVDDIAAQISVD